VTTNRELTDLAAKALGITISWERRRDGKMAARQQSHGYCGIFDPLNDSYDNMRLMAGCRITVDQSHKSKVTVRWGTWPENESLSIACKDDSRMDATRRAVLRAAAEIGATKEA
jgi:hypothetical protein